MLPPNEPDATSLSKTTTEDSSKKKQGTGRTVEGQMKTGFDRFPLSNFKPF